MAKKVGDEEPNCVVMGKTGCGKTTLYNKLCDTANKASWAKASLTRQLFRSRVSHGDNSFIITDTPGTNASQEIAKHAILLKHALTCDPVNAILVVIPYGSRVIEDIYSDFKQTTKPLFAK